MARKLTFFLTGLLVLALAAGVSAQDYNPNGEALPPGASEQQVFYRPVDNNGEPSGDWNSIGSGNATQLARSWNSGPTGGFCNKAYWETTLTSHASVAQWIDWTLATTRKDWRVLKPGEYASDSIDFTIASNNDVVVSFDGFGDLAYLGPDEDVPEGTQDTIETWYGVGESFEAANATGWIRAAKLNDLVYTFENNNDLHYGMQFKFWQRIRVEKSNNSSEYENVGRIRLGVTNLKFWVDPQGGYFKEDQTGAPPADPYDFLEHTI